MNLYCHSWLDSKISLIIIGMFLSVFIKLTAAKTCLQFWCLLSGQLTYKSADSWPRVSTDKHTFVVGLVPIPDIRQVLDPGYHNNSLWL